MLATRVLRILCSRKFVGIKPIIEIIYSISQVRGEILEVVVLYSISAVFFPNKRLL